MWRMEISSLAMGLYIKKLDELVRMFIRFNNKTSRDCNEQEQ